MEISSQSLTRPKERLCGHCRLPGHTKRTCESYAATQLVCNCTVSNDGGSLGRLVGWDSQCPCLTCTEYRKFNKPTPKIAYQIELDIRLAKKIDEENKKWPIVTLQNVSRNPIYVYGPSRGNESRNNKLYKALEEGESWVYHSSTYEYYPYTKNTFSNFIITDNDYGNYIHQDKLSPRNVLKFITLRYGGNKFIEISNEESSNEDKWKEAALKSRYLLDQLERLGANQNPNYEPIMDMIQDIEFPEYSEQDKERAGVSSLFTNIHETTGIDES